jgi:uncharacterized protein (TIGR02453 family)
MHFEGFSRKGTRFLADLRQNNSKAWFDEHRDIYDEHVKEPMLAFVRDAGVEFQKFAPKIIADPRINGSIYRIYRDVRFSRNKLPYKTHVAAIFWPEGGAKHGSACYYIHLEPEKVMIGGGLYMPESAVLQNVREALAEHHDKFRKLLRASAFKKAFGEMYGESLKRPPRGFDKEHPAIELIKQKQFLASVDRKTDGVVYSRKILTETMRLFKALTPFNEFLNSAIGLSMK